jgi:hypothetical protein
VTWAAQAFAPAPAVAQLAELPASTTRSTARAAPPPRLAMARAIA